MTHWRHVLKRKNDHLLFAEDIGPKGTKADVEVTSSGVFEVEGADKKSKKAMPWIGFTGKDGKPKKKVLALNVTNSKTMQTLTGTSTIEEWRGWVRLIVTETDFYDQQAGSMATTECIRIAPTRPPGARKPSPATDTNTTGSGATQDSAAAELDGPDPEEQRMIEERERGEVSGG